MCLSIAKNIMFGVVFCCFGGKKDLVERSRPDKKSKILRCQTDDCSQLHTIHATATITITIDPASGSGHKKRWCGCG